MGRLVYGASTRVDVDDRALAHLQLVIVAKLRRREGFAFSWRNPGSEGGGRRTVWIHPGVPVEFHFAEDAPVIDRGPRRSCARPTRPRACTSSRSPGRERPGQGQGHPRSSRRPQPVSLTPYVGMS